MIKYFYIRFTDFCNVGCKHCYLTNQRRKNYTCIDKNQIDLIKKQLNKLGEENKFSKKYTIRIYGGEILLCKEEIIKYFLELFKNYKIEIQTSFYPYFHLDNNLVLQKIKNLFLYENLIISTSYDFFGIRTFKKDENLYKERLIEIIKLLNSYNKFPKLIVTITSLFKNNEEYVYNELKKIRPYFNKIQYNIYDSYDYKKDKLYLNNKEVSEILKNFYNLDEKEDFYVFDDFKYFNEIVKKNFKIFSDYEKNCQSTVLTVEHDLKLGNCPKRKPFNINLNEIKKFFVLKERLKWINFQKNNRLKICNNCEFKNICKGGCPLKIKEFLRMYKDTDEYRDFCPGLYPFLKHIKKRENNEQKRNFKIIIK